MHVTFLLRLTWAVVASTDIFLFMCLHTNSTFADNISILGGTKKDELTAGRVIMQVYPIGDVLKNNDHKLMKEWRRLERLSERRLFLMGSALLSSHKGFATGQTSQTTAILVPWGQLKAIASTKEVAFSYRLMISGVCFTQDSDICTSLCISSFLIVRIVKHELTSATDQGLVLTRPLWGAKGHGHRSKCHVRCVGTCLSAH